MNTPHVEEVETFVTLGGFEMRRFIPASVPTGCNEFVFEKNANNKTSIISIYNFVVDLSAIWKHSELRPTIKDGNLNGTI